jgi:hypothetical protein
METYKKNKTTENDHPQKVGCSIEESVFLQWGSISNSTQYSLSFWHSFFDLEQSAVCVSKKYSYKNNIWMRKGNPKRPWNKNAVTNLHIFKKN